MNALVNPPYEIRDGETIRRAFTGSVVKAINKDARQIEFIISTATADRYGDEIMVSGWDLKNYRQNPVVLFGHYSSIPPIGKAIKTWKDGQALRSIAQFMEADLSAFADSVYRMYVEGYLRAVSVGFRPTKYERIIDEEGNPTYAYKFLKQELLEFSAVPIPANPEALVAARQKGINTLPFKTWAEELLDNWKVTEKEVDAVYGVGRKDIENIRRRAAGAGVSIQVSTDLQDEIMRRNLEAIRRSKAEKEAAKEFSTVDIGGEEHELPLRKLKEGEVLGVLEFSKEEKDGAEVITVTKADSFIQIIPELVDPSSDLMTLSNQEFEGNEMLCLNIKSGEGAVTYGLIGVDTDGNVFARKFDDTTDAEETVDELKNVVEPENKNVEEPKEKDTDADDTKSKSKAEDDDNKPGDNDDPDSDDDDKSKKKPKKALDETDEDQPLDFPKSLGFIENVLCNFEETIKEDATLTLHQQRKKKFLAGYMRELADRLDGGVQTESNTTKGITVDKTKKTETVKQGQFSDIDDVKGYLKDVTEALQPKLAEIVASKLAQLKGRLD